MTEQKNPITPKNPRGAGKRRSGEWLQLKISGLSREMIEHLNQMKSEHGSFGAYLRLLIERDLSG